ncbi:universal stress protein UspA [Paramesorhizobium deserti]|uniref:Universal stress protein UspA n=1 Tax=Paramesorhizobium deserti TaxID=1494590 RepID=A0A135HR42_9HYPH|nr:universal stress protein [Paramesorhizobium deserti]KXF75654.1 universal stress protein UspA [Paramesorhizobium deserti]
MVFNTIMVQLDIDAPATPPLTFAQGLANRFRADLIALAAAQAHVVIPGDDSGVVAVELLRLRTAEIEQRLEELQKEFLTVTGNGENIFWRGELGDPTHFLAMNGRAADLIVTATAAPENRGNHSRMVNAGELILSAGRPVLFAADNLAPLSADKVLVAWKDTREARRAVVDAMPFLAGASEVLVATVVENDWQLAREGAEDVVRFLTKHGVKARSNVREDDQGAEALIGLAHDIGADLIVAGGYGRSRVSEWIFGGMTDSLLKDGSLHRLLSN